MKSFEQGLGGLLGNRELNDKERDKRTLEIEQYLIARGGTIMAASCKDGILLVSVNPNDSQTVFQVYHRIAILGLGKDRDCRDIHKLALASACQTGLNLSKADIDVEDIADEITEELDKNFSYLRSGRGPHKADFMVVELGFAPEEDFLDIISFSGEREKRIKDKSAYARGITILERPVFHSSLIQKDESVLDKNGNPKKDEKDNPKIEKATYLKQELRLPIRTGLWALIKETICSDAFTESIREVALFAGLMIRILDQKNGELEMVYLDREMLKKSKTEERRFHHIWQRITNPNPNKPTDPWQDWRKFVASVYKKAKRGEIHPKLKLLIEFYENIKKELDVDEGRKDLLKGLNLEKIYSANYDFVMNLFGGQPKKEG